MLLSKSLQKAKESIREGLNPMKKKVIIDTDPGHDDAVAILLAAQYFDILGITSVFGNQHVDKTTTNILKILELASLTHIPVFKGSSEPLVQVARYGSAAHGLSGLDGSTLPEPSISIQNTHAVDFIIDTVMATSDVTIIAIGPLTNIGLALKKAPIIKEKIHELNLMGGSVSIGNTTPVAELNIACDPEAAHIVFSSGIKIKMCGLNLTRQTVADKNLINQFAALGNRTGKIIAELLDWYSNQVIRLYGLKGASIHDACTVAWMIDPNLITAEQRYVEIELDGKLTRGMTVCDQRFQGNGQNVVQGDDAIQSGKPPNVEIGMRIDTSRFYEYLIHSISLYN